MKNKMSYPWAVRNQNQINLERLLYHKDQVMLQSKLGSHVGNLDQIVDHMKEYLYQGIHRSLIQNAFGNKSKKKRLQQVIHSYVSSRSFMDTYANQITSYSLDEITTYLVEKIVGLDVLQPLVEQSTITDINCIRWDNIWVDDIYEGEYKTEITFASPEDYEELISRFVLASGKTYSYARPTVDIQMPYMRINIVGQDLCTETSVQIRMISKELRLSEPYMLETGYATQGMIALLQATFSSHRHLICGGTGTGKTELLRYFLRYTKNNASMIVIEDTPETYLDELYPNKPIKMWKNREATDDEKKQFGYSYHIRNALRQLPKYIMIQESRGAESLDILEASETDHCVSTTLHASSAVACIDRFIVLCQKGQYAPADFYGKRMVNVFKIGIHIKRFGKVRKINQMVEYIGYENNEVQANILYQYDPLTETHLCQNRMSKELWCSLLEEHGQLTELSELQPE